MKRLWNSNFCVLPELKQMFESLSTDLLQYTLHIWLFSPERFCLLWRIIFTFLCLSKLLTDKCISNILFKYARGEILKRFEKHSGGGGEVEGEEVALWSLEIQIATLTIESLSNTNTWILENLQWNIKVVFLKIGFKCLLFPSWYFFFTLLVKFW